MGATENLMHLKRSKEFNATIKAYCDAGLEHHSSKDVPHAGEATRDN
jgi:hypothetical protein